jgi:hypothetical protein
MRHPFEVGCSPEASRLRGAALEAEAGGGLARSILRQTFRNDHTEPLEVLYTFAPPLGMAPLRARQARRRGRRTASGARPADSCRRGVAPAAPRSASGRSGLRSPAGSRSPPGTCPLRGNPATTGRASPECSPPCRSGGVRSLPAPRFRHRSSRRSSRGRTSLLRGTRRRSCTVRRRSSPGCTTPGCCRSTAGWWGSANPGTWPRDAGGLSPGSSP